MGAVISFSFNKFDFLGPFAVLKAFECWISGVVLVLSYELLTASSFVVLAILGIWCFIYEQFWDNSEILLKLLNMGFIISEFYISNKSFSGAYFSFEFSAETLLIQCFLYMYYISFLNLIYSYEVSKSGFLWYYVCFNQVWRISILVGNST